MAVEIFCPIISNYILPHIYHIIKKCDNNFPSKTSQKMHFKWVMFGSKQNRFINECLKIFVNTPKIYLSYHVSAHIYIECIPDV